MWKTKPHKINGNEIDGKTIALLQGMNWWFAWGRKEFDIRKVASVLDRQPPKTVTEGHYCARSHACKKWIETWIERRGLTMAQLMKKHDELIRVMDTYKASNGVAEHVKNDTMPDLPY